MIITWSKLFINYSCNLVICDYIWDPFYNLIIRYQASKKSYSIAIYFFALDYVLYDRFLNYSL